MSSKKAEETARTFRTFTTQSETLSAYAERNIRSLQNILYKHLEHKWIDHYINKLIQFSDTINSRVNRVTKLVPNKVSGKHVPQLRSLAAEKSAKFVKKPRFLVGDTVRIAKQDLPFEKGYKLNFTYQIFTIRRIATFNPPTYNLKEAESELIQGMFYEAELTQDIWMSLAFISSQQAPYIFTNIT